MMSDRLSIKNLFVMLFKEKSDSGFVQFFRYLFVGGFSALADILTLFFCASVLHIYYLLAAALAFIVGNIVNYFLSIAWVFKSSGQVKKELLFFTIIGLGGLVLNELIIWISVEFFHLYYLIAKLVAVALIVFYSFSLRRILLMKLNDRSSNNIEKSHSSSI